VHALTDITGFGLGGHAHEMAVHSGLAFRLDWSALPLLPGAEKYAREGVSFGGAKRNLEYYGKHLQEDRPLEDWQRALLFDPQTSGGLLAAVAAEHVPALGALFESESVPVWRIGTVEAGPPGTLRL
jgi:selenide,water dikinase